MIEPSSLSFSVQSLESMKHLASSLAKTSPKRGCIALNGTLGAGKTQFVRYFCETLGVSADSVSSPTYVLMQRYASPSNLIYHLDFYRLKSVDEAWDLGIDELFEKPLLVLIEWAAKFEACLPDDRLEIQFAFSGEDRTAHIRAFGIASESWLNSLQLRI